MCKESKLENFELLWVSLLYYFKGLYMQTRATLRGISRGWLKDVG